MDGLTKVVLGNVVDLLGEQGRRRSELAGLMRMHGYKWHGNHLTQLLAGRGDLTIGEVAKLAECFQVGLDRLLDGDSGDLWSAPDGTQHSLTLDRRGLTAGEWPPLASDTPPAPDEAEIAKLARRLGQPAEMVDWAAHALYGVGLVERREQLLGDTTGLSPRTVQARRGHITRKLGAQIADQIGKWED